MGNNHSRWYSKQKRKVILVGLESGGKSTLLDYIKTKKFNENQTPTQDSKIETIQYEKKLKLIIFDLAGGERQRIFWRHNFEGTQGVIFIIDAFDEEKFEIAKKELLTIIYEKTLKEAAILIFFNKIDKLQKKSDIDEYIKRMSLQEIIVKESSRIKVFLCSIKDSFGISEGLSWFMDSMKPI